MATAMVTGASSGIGAKYAERLAAQGFDLVIVARNKQRLTELASKLSSQFGIKVEILSLDLGLVDDLSQAVSALYTNSSIDLIVNSAGLGPEGPVLQSDYTSLDAMVQLNVVALHQLTLAAARAFSARGTGTIINIASVVAYMPELFNASYCATKAFVLALTEGLAAELSSSGIRVQAVLPGITRTEIFERAGFDINSLDPNMIMDVNEMVDASINGLKLGEVITIPSLQEIELWESFDASRKAMLPYLSQKNAAVRYKTVDA
jgi:uncharacterized protein